MATSMLGRGAVGVIIGSAPRARGRGGEVWRDDLTAALLSATLVTGLYLDGWSHLHQQDGRLGSFLTPWHGLLYAGFTANAVWVVTRNRHLWDRSIEPSPALHRIGHLRLRYPYAMIGLLLAGTGMLGDAIWHTALGEERDVARVIAPFHILLFAGATLLVAAPLRSAWHAPDEYPRTAGLARLAPAVLSLTLLSALASFLLQWLSPFVDWHGGPRGDVEALALPVRDGLQVVMAARAITATMVMVGPLVLAGRRWRLPFGTATFAFTVVATSMAALGSFELGATVFAAVVGGLAFDVVALALAPRTRAWTLGAATVAPFACWGTYFVLVAAHYDAGWPSDFALGVASLGALVGLTLSLLLAIADLDPVA